MQALLAIMARLRDPNKGCPWDLEQDMHSIIPHTLEEVYEVEEAIATNNMRDLPDELGDLLFQVVFLSHLAQEQSLFNFQDVVKSITDKLIRRHPHIFGNATITSAEEQTASWEAIKAQERKGKKSAPVSVLDDVPYALPALMRASKLQKRASQVGFDWDNVQDVIAKLEEEIGELKEAIEQKNPVNMKEELGDMLFAMVNIANHLNIKAEDALRGTNRKFIQRFQYIEQKMQEEGKQWDEMSLQELDTLWETAKSKLAQ